ncbi:MAG: METTL5 family protein [Candidatus Odinarchaeota archaeon]
MSNLPPKIPSAKEYLKLVNQLTPDSPSRKLEQYITPSQLLSQIHEVILPYVKNEGVIDLGCGTGVLGIFCKLLGASIVLCVDIDQRMVLKGKGFTKKFNIQGMNWLLVPLEFLNTTKIRNSKLFETVISNPPFGVWRQGLDRIFVEKGMSMANVVISFHKSNIQTRKLFSKLARFKKFDCEILVTTDFLLTKTMDIHKEVLYPVSIDIYKFEKRRG